MEQLSLTSIGLFLDIVGVGILFLYGPPQPKLDTGIGLALEDGTPVGPNGETVAELDQAVLRRRKRFSIMSKLGLIFILFGFVLQLIDSVATQPLC